MYVPGSTPQSSSEERESGPETAKRSGRKETETAGDLGGEGETPLLPV